MIELVTIKEPDCKKLFESIRKAKASEKELKKKVAYRKFLNDSYMIAFRTTIPKDIVSINIV